MAEFAKASLAVIALLTDAGPREKARFSEPKRVIDVQFNPTSLKIQYSNHADAGGVTVKAQPRQNASVQSSVLSFELEYDTAEEDGVDVRTRTAAVRRFVQPPADEPKSPAPLVQFHWGNFLFNGRVTQVTEDIDYFSPDGRALRARLSLSITEQDPSLEANAIGPGARTDARATEPGGSVPVKPASRPLEPPPGARPGQRGTAAPAQVVAALDGESLHDLAARIGGSPAAWRALADGVEDPLNLPAGLAVRAGAEIAASGARGGVAGFAVGMGAGSVVGAGDAEVTATASGSAAALLPAGLRLTAAGGVAAAAARLAGARARAEAGAARASFSVRDAGGPPGARPSSTSDPLDPASALVDPRLLAYGRALPLRARPQPATAADSRAGGSRSLTARARPREAAVAATNGPPWERLTPGTSGRAAADAAQRARDARPSTMRWRPGGDCR